MSTTGSSAPPSGPFRYVIGLEAAGVIEAIGQDVRGVDVGGTLVVQLVARAGIRVAGSASAENSEYLQSLGAELALDYRDTS